jgi:hypothetical protein
MTRPVTSSKVILVEDRGASSEARRGAPVRRYRLARLQLEGRSTDHASRFEHLKRVYD